MIRLHCRFFSDALGRDAQVTVLLPSAAPTAGSRYPVLYLLHGLSDSADSHSLAIVLPNAGRSFYCDMVYGERYYTHVSQEIPTFCETLFPISREPQLRYIAGNSMGAYGACKIALKEPGRFSKVGLLSGVLDVSQMVTTFPELHRDWLLCFGGTQVPESEDLLKLLTRAPSLPAFYHYCGTQDFLAEGNRTFCALCRENGIPLTSHWEEGGYHEWRFWDKQLPHLLDWLEI